MLNWFYKQREYIISAMAIFFLFIGSANATTLIKKNTTSSFTYQAVKNDGTPLTGLTNISVLYYQHFDTGTITAAGTTTISADKGYGVYYGTITAAMANCDYLVLVPTSSTTGFSQYPLKFKTTVTDPKNLATTDDGGTINVTGGAIDTVTTATTVTAVTTVNGLASGVITADSIATDAIGAAELAADAGTELGTAVQTVDISAYSGAKAGAYLKGIYDKLPTNYIIGSSGQTAKDDEIDAIKLLTDKLTFDAGNHLAVDVHEILGVQADTTTAGILNINVKNWGGTTAPANTGDAYAIVNNGTYGNSALNTAISGVPAAVANLNISAYSGAGYLGTYLKYCYDTFVSTWTPTVKASIVAIEVDTSAMDTSTELRTLLTGSDTAVSTLVTSDNIGINWADVSNPTTAVGLSGTTIGTVTTYTDNTPQTGDSYAQFTSTWTVVRANKIDNIDTILNSAIYFAATTGSIDTESNTTTIVDKAFDSYANDYFNGMSIVFTNDNNNGLEREVLDFDIVASSATFTISTLPQSPTIGGTFIIKKNKTTITYVGQ